VNLAVERELRVAMSRSAEDTSSQGKAYIAYRRARPGQALAYPGLQARARLDLREFQQGGPSFIKARPWPVGNTGLVFFNEIFRNRMWHSSTKRNEFVVSQGLTSDFSLIPYFSTTRGGQSL